jgi:hypothetical protein
MRHKLKDESRVVAVTTSVLEAIRESLLSGGIQEKLAAIYGDPPSVEDTVAFAANLAVFAVSLAHSSGAEWNVVRDVICAAVEEAVKQCRREDDAEGETPPPGAAILQ